MGGKTYHTFQCGRKDNREFDSSDDIPCFPTQKFQTETWKDVHIDELLTGRQKQEVVDLLIEFQDIFIDDTSIFSHNWKAQIQHLRDVFTRIRGANLTIKPSKCHLGGREVSVGKGQIKVQPDKVRAIKEYPRPKSKKDVRSVLGFPRYYRKHIKNFSELALPLTDLTKKGKATIVELRDACEKAFNDLKSALSAEPVLKSPDFDKHFYLQVDASD